MAFAVACSLCAFDVAYGVVTSDMVCDVWHFAWHVVCGIWYDMWSMVFVTHPLYESRMH